MAHRARCRHPWRDGPSEPATHPAHEGTGRALREHDAAVDRPRGRVGGEGEPPPGEDGVRMELRPGYKQTEVGVIPEDWEVTPLGTHATFKTGPFGSALHKADYVDGGIPVINPMQIVGGRIRPTPSMAIMEKAARKLSDFRLSAGDVVIGRRGEMGRCAVVHAEEHGWLCGTGSMIIRTRPSL